MQRTIIIGASNLARGLAQAIESARAAARGPVEAFLADGHGRSFGGRSRVLGRTLPGVLDSKLWSAIENSNGANGEERQPWAVITDVGNDLMFGYSVDSILGWIDDCLDRLNALHARTSLALPPMARLQTLSPATFAVFRRVLFPSNRMTMDEALEGAVRLDAGLRRIAADRALPIIEPAADDGLDPIHIRLPKRAEAWRAFFAPFQNKNAPPEGEARESRSKTSGKLNVAENLYIRSRPPDLRWILGVEQRKPQPSVRLKDGSVIGFY